MPRFQARKHPQANDHPFGTTIGQRPAAGGWEAPATWIPQVPMLSAKAVPGVAEELRAAFSQGLSVPATAEPRLGGALQRTLAHPGSLVRARIVYEMSRACDLSDAQAKRLAISIEYFHTASLLFDDLPCMDDATHRRGAPCVHRTHGEAAAVLAALGLVSRAYALLWQGLASCTLDRQTRAVACVEECLGVAGVLNGQSQDLHYGSLADHRRWPEKIAASKTASLIRLALVLPLLAGGASQTETLLAKRLAVYWGIAYQIVDDLKDVGLSMERTGKTSTRDETLDRPNLVLAEGALEALTRLERLMQLADDTLERLLILLPKAGYLLEFRTQFQAGILEARSAVSDSVAHDLP